MTQQYIVQIHQVKTKDHRHHGGQQRARLRQLQPGHNVKEPKLSSLLYLVSRFRHVFRSLAVGTKTGYKLYSLTSTDSLEPIYSNGKNQFGSNFRIDLWQFFTAKEDVYIAERLFSSSLVAIVTQSAPRKLVVSHFKKGTEICNYSYSSKILAVKMNRAVSVQIKTNLTQRIQFLTLQRLVVCLEESLFIHNIRDMKVLHTIRETPPNKTGLCALSSDSDNCYLAYPGHSSVGELQIFDALNLTSTTMIAAHTGQLAAIQFSPLGNLNLSGFHDFFQIILFQATELPRPLTKEQ